jgi:hypothetical protein
VRANTSFQQTISQAKLAEGIINSCCLLLVLNDQTLSSTWCRFEVECAQSNNIPIVCIVDCDKQTMRSVVDAYMESGDSFLFDEQVISITSQGREHSYTLIIDAIKRAARASFTTKQTTPTPPPVEVSVEHQSKPDRVHELDDNSQTELMAALHSKFGSAAVAFDSFCNDEGTIGKKEWKRLTKRMLPTISNVLAKALRKKLPKRVTKVQFLELLGEVKPTDKQDSTNKSPTYTSSQLTELPSDVPVLPTSFKSRPHAHEQLVAALLDSGGNRSTAVTAPKSRVSSQGMGGVGKTMLTAAVVRDGRVRGAFESIAWIGMSQQPDLLQLQAKLYQQLHPENELMPSKAISVEAQLRELSRLSCNRVLLVCLDDICKYEWYDKDNT